MLYLCPSYAEEKLRSPFVCGLIRLSLDSSTPFVPPGAVFGGAYRSFEGTIPFLDVEARESLVKAKPTQEVEVQALGSLLVLKVEERTKRFLSFGTGALSFEMVALAHSGGDILCCITTIKEPFVYSSISFFNKRGETLSPESLLPNCPIANLLLPEASDQDRVKVFGLSRSISFSSSEEFLNVSLVPESAPTEEEKEHWRTLLRPEPLRLKWKRKAFQLQ